MAEKKLKKIRRRTVVLAIGLLLVGVIVFPTGGPLLEKEKDFRTRFRRAAARWFPDEAAEVAELYGLRRVGADDARAPGAPDKTVVLIHGLDDPGKVWMNLAPALDARGFDVRTMTYPNDQPVTESARFFADQLSILKSSGVDRIAIAAHGWGGWWRGRC
ncbi:MAG: alpha/beta hydrolase [Desulfobacterales bacterium]|nr:alpha/beta hydrolase [Desulfobacterales bacterium]